MPKTLFDELTSTLKFTLKDGESYEQFAVRATNRINKLDDTQWKALDKGIQKWSDAVLRVRDDNPAPDEDAKVSGSHLVGLFPELAGFPIIEEGTEGEDGEEVEEEASLEDDEANADGEEKADAVAAEGGEETSSEGEAPDGEETPSDEAASAEESAPRKKLGKSKLGKAKEKPVKSPKVAKEAKAPKPAKVAKKANGSRMGLNKDHKIKIVAKENPHRAGTGRFKRWPKYKEGMTVAAALKVGLNANNIRYSVADGHIKIVP